MQMGDIFTAKQRAERLIGKGGRISLSLLFLCPKCGHANRPATRKLDSVKLYLLDELPPCRKCGWELKKRNYDRTTIPRALTRRALRELGLEEASCGPVPVTGRTRSKARFIVDEHGKIKVHHK